MQTRHRIVFGILLLGIFQQGAQAKPAGRVQFTVGEVKLIAASGQSRNAKRGEEVNSGDAIITTSRGRAQIRMADGGMLAIRPNSELSIDDFRYQRSDAANNRSFFSLLKGSFRSITGLIGKLRKPGFRVRTAVATIGIRGSDADIGYDPARKLAGVRTFTGEHTITSNDAHGNAVTLTTGPGQIATAVAGSAPIYVESFPFATPAPRSVGKRPSKRDAGRAAGNKPPPRHGGDGRTGMRGPPPVGPRGPTGARDGGGRLAVPISAGNTNLQAPNRAKIGTGVVGADMFITGFGTETGNGFAQVDSSGNQEIFLATNGAVTGITDNAGEGFRFAAEGAQLVRNVTYSVKSKQGSVAARGNWGVWQGDFKVFDQSQRKSSISGFHFATADILTPDSAIRAQDGISFSFSRIGGIATNENGELANSYIVNATGTFSNGAGLGSISINADADFATGSTGWKISGVGNIAALTRSNEGIQLNGICQGCAMMGSARGASHGRFIGSNAQGLILGVGASDPQTGAAMTGTAVMQRQN